MELIDHRSIQTEIPLGGAARAFRLEAKGEHGFVAYVTDDSGNGAEVEMVFDERTLFKVRREGIEVSYDHVGNLAGLAMDITAAYALLPPPFISMLDEETLMAAAQMDYFQSGLMVDIDLRDGLALGDLGGWCQITVGANMERTNEGIGGWEMSISKKATVYPIAINETSGEPIGTVYLTVGLIDGLLKIGLGDKYQTYVTKFRRLIDAEKISLAKTPAGALFLLSSLVEI